MSSGSTRTALAIAGLAGVLAAGCATFGGGSSSPTKPDKTVKGAAIGAGAGAAASILAGKREADEILAGAAIGAGIGAGVGAYMDHQEAKLARIPGTVVERVGDDTILVHFESDVLFEVDSAVLDASARSALDQVGAVLIEYPKTAIVVQGHTDSTGSEQHNEQLSQRRAQGVANYLIGRGVDAGRLVALGYGESMPVADNATAEGRARNRRVEVLLKAKVT
jgi:outer membrane protein OmpA-like peptidoglycan-associated protein